MTVETRVDPQTGGWRLIAPTRAARPDDARPDNGRSDEARPADARPAVAAPVCPFCPGNEHMTPPERMRVPPGAPDWRIRVVPNKYAVVSPAAVGSTGPAGSPAPDGAVVDGLDGVFPATGDHEVVIESPVHDWDLRRASAEEAMAILAAMRERCRALSTGRPAVIAFWNYGKAAGASLSHPHSQIVALDRTPPALGERWGIARGHHAATGRRLVDDMAGAERAAGVRVVADAGDLLVFQPRAAGVPHHTLLVPRDGRATLADATDDALAAVAATLPGVLAALAGLLDDPAYNVVVHAGPADDGDAGRWYQWHLSVHPRVTTLGGLELATDLAVNPRSPEQTAPLLREALAGTGAPAG